MLCFCRRHLSEDFVLRALGGAIGRTCADIKSWRLFRCFEFQSLTVVGGDIDCNSITLNADRVGITCRRSHGVFIRKREANLRVVNSNLRV